VGIGVSGFDIMPDLARDPAVIWPLDNQ